EAVVHVNFRALSENPAMRAVIESRGTLVPNSTITANMLDHLCFAGKVRSPAARDVVAVFRFRHDYDPNNLFDRPAGAVKRRGISGYYTLSLPGWSRGPTSRRLVLAEEQRALVDRRGNPGGSLRGDLRTAFESAEGPVRGAAVGPSAQLDFRFDFSPWV